MDPTGRSISSYNVNDDFGVDLTLKLGLPNEDHSQSHLRHQVDHNPTTNFSNYYSSGPYTTHFQEAPNSYGMFSGANQVNMNLNATLRASDPIMNYGMVNHGVNAGMPNLENHPNAGQNINFNGNQIAWLQQNYMNSSNQYRGGGGSTVAIPTTTTPDYFNAPLSTMNDSSRNNEDIIGGSSNNSRREDSRRRSGTYNDPSKRCTNYNCNTNDTPMWRKGPLGPKTLCNACGIKYRKEMEKKRAKETASSSNALKDQNPP